WKGVGKYDEAAIIFAYSGTTEPGYVEVFENARKNAQQFPGSDGNQVTVNGAGFDLPLNNAAHLHQGIPSYGERFHYSMLPLHFGVGNDVESVMADGLKRIKTRKDR